MNWLKSFGPGLLVTAAYIGPGTVTTASQAGARFRFDLGWTVLFAVAATIILQEMSARLGLVGRIGLGEAVRAVARAPFARFAACGLIVAAIGLGNAAYQTGNLTGAAAGAEMLTGWPLQVWAAALAVMAFALLWSGAHKLIEIVLIGLVALMSVVFLATAALSRPDLAALGWGLLVPRVDLGALATIVGLIGTTVVPYNLFMHASLAQKKWPADAPVAASLRQARRDAAWAIAVGGAITLSVLVTAAALFPGQVSSPVDMAKQLEPLLGGSIAKAFFAVGLLAAGLSSAITAPLAAGYALCGALGWPVDIKSRPFRVIWIAVLGLGAGAAVLGMKSPTETILFAQVANGLILPWIAGFLLLAMNQPRLLGEHRNGWIANLLGGAVTLVVSALGAYIVLDKTGLLALLVKK